MAQHLDSPRRFSRAAMSLAFLVCVGCTGPALLESSPPLAGVEEPPRYLSEPDDEAQRRELPPGSFAGLQVRDGRQSLDALVDEPQGLEVVSVVENSPAQAAGLLPGDLLLEVLEPRDTAQSLLGQTELWYPSHWRALELGLSPGSEVVLLVDRGGREWRARLRLAERVAPAPREASVRLREEQRVGVVLRTPTEVEARAAGLAPGAGAVVVGLAATSPWRRAGLLYGDVIATVDGKPLPAPAALLDTIRLAEEDARLLLGVVREGQRVLFDVPLSARARQLSEVYVPLLFSYRRERERRSYSALLGIVRRESTPAAWSWRLLWVIRFGGGDSDRLQEVDG